ncbi:hypothetical protein DFH07DRAFT_1022056, partial [Mycena maculata]
GRERGAGSGGDVSATGCWRLVDALRNCPIGSGWKGRERREKPEVEERAIAACRRRRRPRHRARPPSATICQRGGRGYPHRQFSSVLYPPRARARARVSLHRQSSFLSPSSRHSPLLDSRSTANPRNIRPVFRNAYPNICSRRLVSPHRKFPFWVAISHPHPSLLRHSSVSFLRSHTLRAMITSNAVSCRLLYLTISSPYAPARQRPTFSLFARPSNHSDISVYAGFLKLFWCPLVSSLNLESRPKPRFHISRFNAHRRPARVASVSDVDVY